MALNGQVLESKDTLSARFEFIFRQRGRAVNLGFKINFRESVEPYGVHQIRKMPRISCVIFQVRQ